MLGVFVLSIIDERKQAGFVSARISASVLAIFVLNSVVRLMFGQHAGVALDTVAKVPPAENPEL